MRCLDVMFTSEYYLTASKLRLALGMTKDYPGLLLSLDGPQLDYPFSLRTVGI